MVLILVSLLYIVTVALGAAAFVTRAHNKHVADYERFSNQGRGALVAAMVNSKDNPIYQTPQDGIFLAGVYLDAALGLVTEDEASAILTAYLNKKIASVEVDEDASS